MKNKRYKREAKRIYAECNNNVYCSIGNMKMCKFYDRCREITITEPCNLKLRKLEILCKN